MAIQVPIQQRDPSREGMPAGITNAYWFQLFNSCSFSLIIGVPILLFLRDLGASTTVLGIAAALTPLLNILQIPAARYVETTGYRSFVLRGWSIRSIFILCMAGVTILPEQIDATTRIALALFLLVCYNASRGFSACGFLPWISQLVPGHLRGVYVSRDQIYGMSAIVVTSFLAGLFLRIHPHHTSFSVIFLVSFLAALGSLWFLKRIPDVPVPEDAASRSHEAVPWASFFRLVPFRRFLIFNFIVLTAWAGSGVIVVPFLREEVGISDSFFLMMNSLWGIVYIGAAYVIGKSVDRTGSKPLLALSGILQLAHFAGWGAVAAGGLPFNWWTISFQQVTWGLAFALFQVANTRLIMEIVPAMGRSHFFAIFSVSNSLAAGLLPVVWGLLADGLHGWSVSWGSWTWHAYSLVYYLVFGVSLLSLVALHFVEEKKAMDTDRFFHELFVSTPARGLSRLFTKRAWL